MFSWWIVPYIIIKCSSLSFITFFYLKIYFVCYKYCHTTFLLVPFAWNIIFHPFALSLYLSLKMRWISCRYYVVGSCFLSHFTTLCLLISEFSWFTFRVVIDIWGLTTFIFFFCFLIVLCCHSFFSLVILFTILIWPFRIIFFLCFISQL